jgi:cell division protein FtsA
MDVGVAMVDLGGGTADLAIYSEGSLVHTAVLAIGGNHFTHDVAVGLRLSHIEAENVKVQHGSVSSESIEDDEMFEARGMGGRPPQPRLRKELSGILELRAEELFELVGEEIKKSGHEEKVVAGLVLAGGAALLDGIESVAERVLALPVRVGSPRELSGLRSIAKSPVYATAVGLILEAWQSSDGEDTSLEGIWQKPRSVVQRIKEWFF